MVKELVSTGIIPVYMESGVQYLLLKYPQGHWGFPKGHVEKNESHWETAVRELKEETGLSRVKRIGEFKDEIEYWFQRESTRHEKVVYFFGGRVYTRSVTLSEEHDDYTWTSTERTLEIITYENERNLFTRWLHYFE